MVRYDGKVTIWIGKEDREKWDAIESKPDWLHERLNQENEFWAKVRDVSAEVLYGDLPSWKFDNNQYTQMNPNFPPDLEPPRELVDSRKTVPSKCPTCNKYACECKK